MGRSHPPCHTRGNLVCVYDSPYVTHHPSAYYCGADEIDDEATCESNGYYWNFSNNTCQEGPPTFYCPQDCFPYNQMDSGGCWSAVDYCRYEFGCGFDTSDGGQGCCC